MADRTAGANKELLNRLLPCHQRHHVRINFRDTAEATSEDGETFRIPASATSNTNPAANAAKALVLLVRAVDTDVRRAAIEHRQTAGTYRGVTDDNLHL